ncbi:cytochrome b/b6 domain-containing protein [Methylocystis echinoides]|jgi:thiosulfate reductase cytochrome b subunit|uniref:cytochrome b/b6 domain-containing protein n=1 Tax=Methylocystis echinoides TaxID=29468 RepID=UPI00342B5365
MLRKASTRRGKLVHPLFVRVTHWINAFAAIAMLMSGLRIYNAAPLYEVRFPGELTLGGWLAGALAWHFAAMWLLLLNGFAYLGYGVFSGHFLRRILDVRPIAAYRNVKLEMKHLLLHGTGDYNIVQRVLYVLAIGDMLLLFFSGLALWKPVQLHELTKLLGGYDQARHIHFAGMAILASFIVIHGGVALAVKGTIASMVTGRLTKAYAKERQSR